MSLEALATHALPSHTLALATRALPSHTLALALGLATIREGLARYTAPHTMPAWWLATPMPQIDDPDRH